MSSLDHLFDDTDGRQGASQERDIRELTRLRRMVGAAPSRAGSGQGGSTPVRVSLAEIIGDAGAVSPAPTPPARGQDESPPPPIETGRPGGWNARRRTAGDWASVGAAVAAIAAVVAVGALVAIDRTTSDEVSQAASSLRQREAELRNRTTTLETSLSLYDSANADAVELAEQAEPALGALEGKSDETARQAAVQALTGFRDALSTAPRPAGVVEPVPSGAAPTDLPSVAARLDAVRAAALEVDEAIDRTRDARSALAATEAGFFAAFSTFGATLPVSAASIAAENPYAPEAYRSALVVTADDVVGAQRRGESGADQMVAHAAAVDALRTENQRAIDSWTPVRRSNGGWVPAQTPEAPAGDNTTGEPLPDEGTDPGSDPVVPIEPTPIEPTPIEPAP